MPYKPKRNCAVVGCPELVMLGEVYCKAHKKQKQQKDSIRRGNAHDRGYDSRWSKIRLMHLARHPLCEECLKNNMTTPAVVVDHITPHKGNIKLFNDPNNMQSLCTTCHNIKTAKEDGGFGNTIKG